MTTTRRKLNDIELAECAALKAQIAAHNAKEPRARKLTQELLAQELGMTQGNLSAHLNGKRAISKDMAAKVALLLGIPVALFSPRLGAEIAQMARAVESSNPGQDAEQRGHFSGTSMGVPMVARLISEAITDGRLTAGDAEELRRMAIHLISKNENFAAGPKAVPDRLTGLVDAAYEIVKDGGDPDDILKMLEKGMIKQQPKEEPKAHEFREKRTR